MTTLGYSGGEALVLARLQAIAGGVWTSSNSGRGTWYMLNNGLSDHYAFVFPGPFTSEFVTVTENEDTYVTCIEIWQAYVDDGTSLTNLEALMTAVLDQFDKYRKLGDTGDTIVDSTVKRGDEPQERWKRGGNGPAWLSWKVYVEWKEQNVVQFAE